MQYGLGTKDAATQPYTTSIPAKTEAGTYYVWYKVIGDENHKDAQAGCVEVIIKSRPVYQPSAPSSALTVTSEIGTITRVTVDGKTVNSKYYFVSGSNVVLSEEFMSTLAPGKHTIRVYDGKTYATATWTVTGNATPTITAPKTADPGVAIYGLLAVSSTLGLGEQKAESGITGRKRLHQNKDSPPAPVMGAGGLTHFVIVLAWKYARKHVVTSIADAGLLLQRGKQGCSIPGLGHLPYKGAHENRRVPRWGTLLPLLHTEQFVYFFGVWLHKNAEWEQMTGIVNLCSDIMDELWQINSDGFDSGQLIQLEAASAQRSQERFTFLRPLDVFGAYTTVRLRGLVTQISELTGAEGMSYVMFGLPSMLDVSYSFLQVRSPYATQSSLKVNLSIPPFLPNSFSPMG